MTYYLPPERNTATPARECATAADLRVDLADLRIFWGPEICRLEYLLHLLDTGRVKDERVRPNL